MCLSLLVSQAGLAQAQDHKTQAIELFRNGTAAFEQHDYPKAARAFEASYEHVHRAAAIYNAARSWDAAQDRARAADDYQLALERTDLGGPEAAEAKKRLLELEERLGVLEAAAPDGWRLSIGRIENASAPIKIHLEPGEYVVVALAVDGTRQQRPVRIAARRTASLRFAAPPLASRQQDGRASDQVRPLPATANAANDWQRPAAWIALGLAGVATATTVVLGLKTLDARDAFYADPTSQSALDEAKALRLGTNVALGAAGVFAVTGVVLMLTSPKDAISHSPTSSR